jgi:tRNA threonylcarbamoyladenosine biosynthesis protein TsaE
MAVFRASAISDLEEVADQILQEAGSVKNFALYGEMGAGKTTLVKAFLKVLGADDLGSSPTFSLVNEYRLPDGNTVYHFDFYRIEDTTEIYDMGYEEYFFGGAYCFVEWPEKMEDLLPEERVEIRITVSETAREISVGRPN